jgi:hypothetical protein
VTGPPGPCGCGCALTADTSDGFEFVEWCDQVGHPLRPFQRFIAIHGLERLPDGRPRFRILLLLISRQNGKTTLPTLLAVWWQFRKDVPLILGTSTKLEYAKESWMASVKLAASIPELNSQHEPGRRWYRLTNGECVSFTRTGNRYKIAASNEEGGRGLPVHRGIADELRQHDTYAAWDALEPACSPRDAQLWAMSNAGSDRSVVLNDLHELALQYIATGDGDRRLGLFEYSAPEGSDPEDVDALLQANPAVGYGLDLEVLLSAAVRAKRKGGQSLTGFLTERMCIRVKLLDPAIDPRAWAGCEDPGDMANVRSRVALVFDVNYPMTHATLYAAAMLPDGRVRVEPVKAWSGRGCVDRAARQIPALVAEVRPRAFGWLPSGPAASVASKLKDRSTGSRRAEWPPPGVIVEEIRGEVPAICMGLVALVDAGQIAHSADPLVDTQIEGTEKAPQGPKAWVFVNPSGDCDAVYALAGAAHLAQTMPKSLGKPRLITP